jgi:hypothetical protein
LNRGSVPPGAFAAAEQPVLFSYSLSLGSVLSDAGWISQIPSRATFMTTGRSQVFTPPMERWNSLTLRKNWINGDKTSYSTSTDASLSPRRRARTAI